jgi:hypothetical protein
VCRRLKNEGRFLYEFKMAKGALLLQRWVFSLLLLKGEMEKLNKIKKRETKRRQAPTRKANVLLLFTSDIDTGGGVCNPLHFISCCAEKGT